MIDPRLLKWHTHRDLLKRLCGQHDYDKEGFEKVCLKKQK